MKNLRLEKVRLFELEPASVLLDQSNLCNLWFAFAPDERIIAYSFQSMTQNHETVIILDFGSQYTQLIARRVREAGVYCEILPFNASIEAINARCPKGLIFSGGPSSVYDTTAPKPHEKLLNSIDCPKL